MGCMVQGAGPLADTLTARAFFPVRNLPMRFQEPVFVVAEIESGGIGIPLRNTEAVPVE